MTREQRYSLLAILFYLVVLGLLCLTSKGLKAIEALSTSEDLSGFAFALVGLGVAFFTAQPLGLLFNTAAVFFYWNLRGGGRPENGGYSAEWQKLAYDFREKTVDRYNSGTAGRTEEEGKHHASESLKQYSSDVFFSYFWQQAPEKLVEWVSRRHSAFFVNMNSCLTIVFAVLLSVTLIIVFDLGWIKYTSIVLVVFILIAGVCYYNSLGPRREAWQLIDLWTRGVFDPRFRAALHDTQKMVSPEEEATAKLRPSFKVMRANDVKVRTAENDRRLYYFDDTVDIVVTTISQRQTEPAHFHTINTESYYVVHGRMLLTIEGQEIWLEEGDLMVVNPGACHRFETTDEEVTFIAIKKESGLDDKKSC